MNEGNFNEAHEILCNCLRIKQMFGDLAGEAAIWHQLASIVCYAGRIAQARDGFRQALVIGQEIGNIIWLAKIWHQLAAIDMDEGRFVDARSGYGKVFDVRLEMSDYTVDFY